MGWLSWIVMGLICGSLAKWIMPGKDPGGIFMTIVIGIVGGVIGGYISNALGMGAIDSFSLSDIAFATGGAVILLFAYRRLNAGKSS